MQRSRWKGATECEESADQLSQEHPQAEPRHRRDHGHDGGLPQDHPDHLATRGAHRSEHRQFLGSLGDDDAECVLDEKRRDEHGDAGEDEKEGIEEAERVFKGRKLLLGRALSCHRFDALGQHRHDAPDHLV